MTTTRTHFTFRVDTWTPNGESIVEHVAGVEDYQGCARHVPICLRTLARHPHHIAAGRTSDRGQPAPARDVESVIEWPQDLTRSHSFGYLLNSKPRPDPKRGSLFVGPQPPLRVAAQIQPTIVT